MSPAAESMLSVEDLHVVYQRSIVALHGVNLTVKEDTITAVLGANGAGKSTIMRAISGFIGLDNARVSQGTIRFRGRPITHRRPHQIASEGVVLIPEREKVFSNLTVMENLAAVSSDEGGAARRRLETMVFDTFPRLTQLRNREAGLLSGGERQMLAIGAAIVCKPSLLLIDELSQGLAPVIVDELLRKLVQLRSDLKVTVLLVEQNASAALKIADHAYVLETGRVILSGSASEVRNDPAVREAYLGHAGAKTQRRSYRDVMTARRLPHDG